MNKEAVKSITDELGADAMCARLGVTEHSIRHARHTGAFPASWFPIVKTMAEDAGLQCPMEVFNWKSPVGPEVSCQETILVDDENNVKGN